MGFRELIALGRSIPSKARALLRARKSLNPLKPDHQCVQLALGVETIGAQEFCSYPDCDCSIHVHISKEQMAIPNNSDSSHSATSDNVVTRRFDCS